MVILYIWACGRLTPLNEDRAFVAAMLVRTAFELPDPEGEVMGVDAAADKKADEGGESCIYPVNPCTVWSFTVYLCDYLCRRHQHACSAGRSH